MSEHAAKRLASKMAIPTGPISPAWTSLSTAIHDLVAVMHAADATLLEHGRRTAHYTMVLAHAIGVCARDLADLYYAAVLHDIGQVMLPENLRNKTGPLSHEEYVLMQCHPRDGARLLQSIPGLRRAALLVAHHHEHWDGSGYPYGLRKTLIPLGSRMLAIAGRFDALCSENNSARVDRRLAMKLIRIVAGSQLDPMLVGVFLQRLMDEPRERCYAETRT